MEKKLTTKEWLVYNEIKSRSELGQWTNVQYLADMLECSKREIRRHIQVIRESNTIQKIIITDYSKGYKLMSNDDEFELLTKTAKP